MDGVTGAPSTDAAGIIGGPRQEVTDLAALAADNTIVVAPEQRASFVVRQLLTGMLKPVQADTVTEESITFEQCDLYYRPWWAFEFHWKPKDKRGVVELDAVTGQVRPGQALMSRMTKMVSRDSLFDIGADTVGLLVPGGSIAVKVAKMAIDHQNRSTGGKPQTVAGPESSSWLGTAAERAPRMICQSDVHAARESVPESCTRFAFHVNLSDSASTMPRHI